MDSHQLFAAGYDSIERVLELGGWDVAEVAVETLRGVPGHPPEGRELEVLDRSPGTWPCGSADVLGLVIAVHGLGQGVVIAVPDGPDRRCRSDLGEAFAVANGGGVSDGLCKPYREER